MYPEQNFQHVSIALSRLTDHYRNKKVIPGALKSYATSIQELENVFWSIINGALLKNVPTGDLLRRLGNTVGAPFAGESDADYYSKVLMQIRVNRSQGLAQDVLAVCDLFTRDTRGRYLDDGHYVSFLVQVRGCLLGSAPGNPYVLASALSKTRSAGVRGELRYTSWAPGNDFILTSRVGGNTFREGTWGSRYAPSVGGKLGAGTEL